MDPSLKKRPHSEVSLPIKKTVIWADELPKPKIVQSRNPEGEELEEAWQYMQKNNPYFCPFPGTEHHRGRFLWRYVALTKHQSNISKDVFEKYYALRRTKRIDRP